ncbi:hypothetical protein [Streptomyces aquilus]|uniref:hypothetical protein n=1 Tax=Streptomyces aquilus TaxID=2548456 RepID=UPI0036B0C363
MDKVMASGTVLAVKVLGVVSVFGLALVVLGPVFGSVELALWSLLGAGVLVWVIRAHLRAGQQAQR